MAEEEKHMQGSRLFQIIYHLLEKDRATAPELAQKLEVSVRTIYRDIDALSGAGVPVYAEPGRNGGIYLMKDFVLDKALLSEKEKQEILGALQSLNAANSNSSSDTLRKLSALFNVSSQNWLEVDFSRWGSKQKDNEKFEALKSAVIRQNAARITYAGSDETISRRTIYPLKLSYRSKAWYVKAYCTEKKGYRLFKLTRILDLEILDEVFSHYAFPEEMDSPQQEYRRILLRFPKEMAYRVYDEFDRTDVTREKDGRLLVSAKMPEDAWLVGFLLSFGTQIEIVEPISLRKILAQQAKQIYEKYKS